MEQKTVLIHSEYKMNLGSLDSILSYVNRPVSSPLLDAKAKEIPKAITEPVKKFFSFGQKTTEQPKPSTTESLNNLTEDKVNAELNELGEDDYKDMSGFLLTAFDFGLEKVFNNFFNKKQNVETQAQKEKLTRLKIVLTKVMVKHGVKFKIELLLIMLLVGYTANRWNSAVPLDNKDTKKPDEKQGKKEGVKTPILTKEQELDNTAERLLKVQEKILTVRTQLDSKKSKSVLEIVNDKKDEQK